MDEIPEVFVDKNWTRTLNFIYNKLAPNDQFILKATNDKDIKIARKIILDRLCKEKKFYEIVKEWEDKNDPGGDMLKAHLMRKGVAEE